MKILKSKKFKWGLVIFWLIFIFSMSHLNAAKSWVLTGRTLMAIGNTTGIEKDNQSLRTVTEEIEYYSQNEQGMHLLRKLAHVLEFLGLSVSLVYAFCSYYDLKSSAKRAFVFGVLYAIFDEVHQLFIEGRTSNPVDIGIDSIGVILGIVIVLIVNKWVKGMVHEDKNCIDF